jgi:hypothetical protein
MNDLEDMPELDPLEVRNARECPRNVITSGHQWASHPTRTNMLICIWCLVNRPTGAQA